MLKTTFKQIRVYYVGYIGTIITLITVAALGMMSCELLGGSIIDYIDNGESKSTSAAIAMFGSVSGFLIMLSVSSLVMASNYSIKRRWKSFSNLRVLGNTYKDIRKIVLIETFILTLAALIIGIPIGVVLSHPVLNTFIQTAGLSSSIKIGWNYILILITIGIILFLTLVVSLFLSRKLKKITIDQVKDINNLESKKSIAFKVIMGLMLIFTPVIVYSQVSLEGGNGQIFMSISLFVPIIGFSISGKYLYSWLIYLIKSILPSSSKISYFLADFKNSLGKIVNITTSIAFIVVFQGVLVTSTKVLAESKVVATEKYYSGLNTYKINDLSNINTIDTNDESIIYKLDAQLAHEVSDSKIKWTDSSVEVIDGKLPYNFGSETSKDVLSKGQAIITSDYPQTKVGSDIMIKINGVEGRYTVKEIVSAPLARAQFNSVFIGFDPSLAINASTSDITIISENKISNENLQEFNPLVIVKQGNDASGAVSGLIQIMVIIFSIINILNFLLLFIYDKRAENALKNTLGATPKVIRFSLIMQAGLIALIGVIAGLYSTLTFTIPYINANPITSPAVSSPIIFSLICVGIVLGTTAISYLIIKITSKKNIK